MIEMTALLDDGSFLLTLGGLMLSGFVAATLIPMSSEIVFALYLATYPSTAFWGFLAVSLTNSLGSATSIWAGLLLRQRLPPRWEPQVGISPEVAVVQKKIPARYLDLTNRYGPVILLLAWVPMIGDFLPLAAGYLGMPWWRSLLFIALGKLLRYGLIWWSTVALLI